MSSPLSPEPGAGARPTKPGTIRDCTQEPEGCAYGEAYLRRLYRESRKAVFIILMGKRLPPQEPFPSDPAALKETLERITSLVQNDEKLEGSRQMLDHYFDGPLAEILRLPRLTAEGDPAERTERLRAAIARHLRLHGLDELDADDCAAMEELKKSSRLQQQLAYLVNYTPNKWLLEQEIGVIEASRVRRLPQDDLTACVLEESTPQEVQPYLRGADPFEWSRDTGRLRGLCLSGGGIRSATFNLGVLQGLASRNLLRRFDYLSSVSGGGYIHQWLAAWIQREEKANRTGSGSCPGLDTVCQHLIPLPDQGSGPRHPEPIRWLRRYSNYLTPEKGLFATDFWVTVAIWMRNTLLNQLILLAMLMVVLMVPHIFLMHGVTNALTPVENGVPAESGMQRTQMMWSIGLAVLLITNMFLLVRSVGMALGASSEMESAERRTGLVDERATPDDLMLGVVIPAMVVGLVLSVLGFSFMPIGEPWRTVLLCGFCLVGMTVVNLQVTISGGALKTRQEAGLTSGLRIYLGYATAAVVSALIATGGILMIRNLFVTGSLVHFYMQPGLRAALAAAAHVKPLVRPEPHTLWRCAVAFGPTLILFVQFVSIILHCGLIGNDLKDWVLEWLARLRAWMTLCCIAWSGLVGIAFFGRWILDTVVVTSHAWVKWPALAAWAATTAGSVLAGKSAQSSGETPGGDSRILSTLIAVGPPIYVLGVLVWLAWLSEKALGKVSHMTSGWPGHEWLILATILLPAIIAGMFGWRVDVNEFSMHSYYRNRLARCYLGASNTKRTPDPLTGFDAADIEEMELSQFLPQRGYTGPFPIFCSSLNISMGEDLAWQERKAAAFAFTPLYSGYHVPWTGRRYKGQLSYNGFVPTDRFAIRQHGVNIATAAAVSGAAVSPNMGYHTSTPMAFLLTMFNVRLGWWMANPRKSYLAFDPCALPPNDAEAYPRPKFAPWELVSELLGKVGDDRKFVYLSDGGHFDNMGLYELVRRRCYEIVICDAEEDAGPVFEGIGMSIRKCRIDFGVEIELDLNQLARDAGTGLNRLHWITGTIRYPETGHDENGDKVGRLLYIKSSITGKEAADVYNYRLQHKSFPQDSTMDQWFTESQFESYRRLGQQVINECPHLSDLSA